MPVFRSWFPSFIALAAIWGASFLFIKVAIEDLAPIYVAFGRCAIGAVFLLAAVAIRHELLPRDRTLLLHLVVSALLLNSMPFALFAYGEQHASSVLAGIWNATTPLFAVVVAFFALHDERPTPSRLAGLLIGFLGVMVVLGPWHGLGGSATAGQLMFAGAAACYGAGFVYTRRFITKDGTSDLALAAAQITFGTLQLAVLLPFVAAPTLTLGAETIMSLLALGALGSGVAYVLNFQIIRQAGATTASTVTYLIPLFSTVLGVLVLSESVSWNQPIGALVVLGGIAIAQGRLRPRPVMGGSTRSGTG